MTPRRELAVAALAGAVGAIAAAGLAGRTWATVAGAGGIDLMPSARAVSGQSLSAVVPALGWAGLAGIAALLATRGWVRTIVGALLAVFGAAIAAASAMAVGRAHVITVAQDAGTLSRLSGPLTVRAGAWWIVVLAGGALLAAAGLATLLRGRRWPGMSARYDRPGSAPVTGDDPASMWKSFDRGDDPTRTEPQEPH